MFRLTLATLLLAGCGWQPIKTVTPIERGNLARPEMQLNPDSARSAYRAHMHEAKSGSMTAADVGGGGCGCD